MTAEPLQKEQGSISVNTEYIFPIIKRSLYSDHEIFLRELVSNALDATQKIKHLSSTGIFQGELGDLKIKVALDKEAKTLTVSDMGIGMTDEEVRKYINQVAFSGAEEFVKKFKEAGDSNEIIGRFGLGFYSAFMVSEQVEIQTLSYQENAAAVHWTCDGSTTYSLEAGSRSERGSDIVLHIDKDSEEFLEASRLRNILKKYFSFVPTPIEFEGELINPTAPLWKKAPSDITDEEYLEFYKTLHPFQEPPLFWIHLNIDHPFNLTGILYFPKFKKDIEPNRNQVHLYSRQVFITEQVQDVVPEYLMLLQGVIDSPDIPLNVSRSYLQSDSNVKKISNYISRKVADKLHEIFKEDRQKFEEKWKDISLFVKYGFITDDKFAEKADKFLLVESSEHKFFTVDEWKDLIAPAQTDKDGNVVILYTHDAEKQDLYLSEAKGKGYQTIILDGILDTHLVGHIERKWEKVRLVRVDSDAVDNLIKKEDEPADELAEDDKKKLTDFFHEMGANPMLNFQVKKMGENAQPITLVRPEWMRRMKEMSAFGGGMGGFDMPETVEVYLNHDHALIQKVNETQDKALAQNLLDLALLTQDLLKGKDLTAFVNRVQQKL